MPKSNHRAPSEGVDEKICRTVLSYQMIRWDDLIRSEEVEVFPTVGLNG